LLVLVPEDKNSQKASVPASSKNTTRLRPFKVPPTVPWLATVIVKGLLHAGESYATGRILRGGATQSLVAAVSLIRTEATASNLGTPEGKDNRAGFSHVQAGGRAHDFVFELAHRSRDEFLNDG